MNLSLDSLHAFPINERENEHWQDGCYGCYCQLPRHHEQEHESDTDINQGIQQVRKVIWETFLNVVSVCAHPADY